VAWWWRGGGGGGGGGGECSHYVDISGDSTNRAGGCHSTPCSLPSSHAIHVKTSVCAYVRGVRLLVLVVMLLPELPTYVDVADGLCTCFWAHASLTVHAHGFGGLQPRWSRVRGARIAYRGVNESGGTCGECGCFRAVPRFGRQAHSGTSQL